MDQLDAMYRALKEYRKQTADQSDLKHFRSVVSGNSTDKDLLQYTCLKVEIEDDWIDAIQKGLVFVGKALGEERQFIRTNGEVIPIEKVKRVTKDSVEHLSKHSNLISRAPEPGEDVVPDQIYTAERLSDYTVYENRFIYTLLVYLKDFVTFRYDKIINLTYSYNGHIQIHKDVAYRGQKVKFRLQMDEEKLNDPILKEVASVSNKINKIQDIMAEINFYLSLPLMIEVAKAPAIKPPIVKTNVLRMNQNFKGAVALYEFITAYDKDGFVTKENTTTTSPFVGEMADEIAELVAQTSFLAYKHNLDLGKRLEDTYNAEEKRIKEEEHKAFLDQLASMKKRANEAGKMEDYVLLLERRVRDLESQAAELVTANQTITKLTENENILKAVIDAKDSVIDEKIEECNKLVRDYEDEIAKMTAYHDAALAEKDAEHELQMAEKEAEHSRETANLKGLHEAEISTLNAQHLATCQEKDQRLQDSIVQYEYRIALNNKEHFEEVRCLNIDNRRMQANVDKANSERDRMQEEKLFAEGKLNAMRLEYGQMDTKKDYTTEENFDELEKQYEVLKRFYKQQWRKVKKRLRKEIFNMDAIKARAVAKSEKDEAYFENKDEAAAAVANGGTYVPGTASENPSATPTDTATQTAVDTAPATEQTPPETPQ